MPASDPIATFTREHPNTGKTQERVAYTPDEVVNLTADGWVQKNSKSSGSAGSSSSGSRSTGSSNS